MVAMRGGHFDAVTLSTHKGEMEERGNKVMIRWSGGRKQGIVGAGE